MALINPYALWLLVLIPIPFLLAYRRRPLRRQVVANLYLWQNLMDRNQAHTAKRINRTWLAALQAGLIAIVVVALARPTTASMAPRVAVVVDVSGSMAAHDGSSTRLDRARERARTVLDGLSGLASVQLIAAGASPRVLGEFASGDGALMRALDGLRPTAGTADLPGAIRLAMASGAQGRDVHVFSDRGNADVESAAPPVSWETIGSPAENLAIAMLSARRLPLEPTQGQILFTVRNYGTAVRNSDVAIAQDGQEAARQSVRVAGDSEETVVVHVPRIGQVIEARLLGEDALEPDNHRLAVVPPLERVAVTLVGHGSAFLEKALTVDPEISLGRRQDVPGATASGAIIVCDGCNEPPESASSVLWIPHGPSLTPAPLTISLPEHPVAASLDLGESFVMPLPYRAWANHSGEVILRAGGVPVVIAYQENSRRVVEMRVDLTASDLTLSGAFPILVRNAIDWISTRLENPLEIVSGEPLRWVMQGPGVVSVTGPDGGPVTVAAAGGYVTVANTDVAGIYRVHSPAGERLFAVNPAIETESDLSGRAVAQASQRADAASLEQGQTEIAPILLMVAFGLLGLEWWYRRPAGLAWHVAMGMCLLLAASRLAVPAMKGPVSAMALLDRSASIPLRAQNAELTRVKDYAASMRRGDRLGVAVFGADAALEARPAERVELPAIRASIPDTGSDIAAGLRLARASLPRQGNRRIVLISDGRETSGSAEREAAYAAADRVRIDVAPADVDGLRRPPMATRVIVPPEVRIGEPFLVSAEVEGSPGATGRLSVYRDDQPFASTDVVFPASGTTSVAFGDRHQQAGVHTYRAVMRDPGDDLNAPAADAGSGAVVAVVGTPTILYVTEAGGTLQPLLGGAGFQIARALPEAMPASVGVLARYDAVVIDDVPSERFSMGQMLTLTRYVEQSGGGLLLLGSARSLTLTGYPTGPLGSVLPIDLRPRAGIRAPSLGLVLVFDKSGSMADLAGGTPKIELARQSVMKVLDVLPPTDSLGVIAFDANPVIVSPLASAQDPRMVSERLRTVEPGGSTVIAPAIEMALQWLNTSQASFARRQILLVSDGRTSLEDAGRVRAAVAGGKVEVSVVAIGPTADRDLLRQLADSSGGRAYFPADVAELPMIVAREAERSLGARVVEERFALRAVAHPVLTGIDRASLPQLNGYVVAAARPTATSALASHLDDPILCLWRSGLGRVGVFTADLASPWSSPLRGWSEAGRLWTQSVRWLSRRTSDQSLRLTIAEGHDSPRIVVESEREDGTALALADVHAVVRTPGGATQEVALHASAPGRYEAPLPTSSAGPYVVSVDAVDRESQIDHHVVGGSYWSASRERRFEAPNLPLLRRIAEMTGGRVLVPGGSPFDGPRSREYVNVSTWLAALALLMFVSDIAAGRRGIGARLLEWRSTSRRSGRQRMAA